MVLHRPGQIFDRTDVKFALDFSTGRRLDFRTVKVSTSRTNLY